MTGFAASPQDKSITLAEQGSFFVGGRIVQGKGVYDPAKDTGNTKTLVSLNLGGPPGTIDHFSIGIPRFSRESITSYLTQRGATPLQGNFAGLHVKDPDGVNVQISSQA